jgi:hypothetical protein
MRVHLWPRLPPTSSLIAARLQGIPAPLLKTVHLDGRSDRVADQVPAHAMREMAVPVDVTDEEKWRIVHDTLLPPDLKNSISSAEARARWDSLSPVCSPLAQGGASGGTCEAGGAGGATEGAEPMAVEQGAETRGGGAGDSVGGDDGGNGFEHQWTKEEDEHLREGEALFRIHALPPLALDFRATTDLVGNDVPLAAQDASAKRKFGIPTILQTRSSDMVNDFNNPSLWTGSFPGLFVSGQAGLGHSYDDVIYHSGKDVFTDEDGGPVAQLMEAVSTRATRVDSDEAGRRSLMSVAAGARKLSTHFTQEFARNRHILAMAFSVIQRMQGA